MLPQRRNKGALFLPLSMSCRQSVTRMYLCRSQRKWHKYRTKLGTQCNSFFFFCRQLLQFWSRVFLCFSPARPENRLIAFLSSPPLNPPRSPQLLLFSVTMRVSACSKS